jgi:pimeloyl-ACP methyl ester carboxylesterase
MVTFVLVHGAMHGAWCWDLVVPELRKRGHDTVTMDLPVDDRDAGLTEYSDVVVAAVRVANPASDLVVVAHSMSAMVAPLVCARLPVSRLILLAGMVPKTGETGWHAFAESDPELDQPRDTGDAFYHDVPAELADEARAKLRHQCAKPHRQPIAPWPEIPIAYLLGRDDRVIPATWLRRVVPERLGVSPDEIDGGHSPFLSRPAELAERLVSYISDPYDRQATAGGPIASIDL